MQRLEVSGAVRPIYGSLGVKRLIKIQLDATVGSLIYFTAKSTLHVSGAHSTHHQE